LVLRFDVFAFQTLIFLVTSSGCYFILEIPKGPEHYCLPDYPQQTLQGCLCFQDSLFPAGYRFLSLAWTPFYKFTSWIQVAIAFPNKLPTHHWVLCKI